MLRRAHIACVLVLAACASAPPLDDDDAVEPPWQLPDGEPADVESGPEVTCAAPDPAANLPFVDITEQAGVSYEPATYPWPPVPGEWGTLEVELTGGFSVADLDGDGHLDLLFTDGRELPRLFLGDGDAGFLAADAAAAGVPGGDGSFWAGSSAADADGDGDVDLLLLGREENVFLRNEGGSFVDATAEVGLAGEPIRSATASWADFDQDGDLDLFVANYGVGSASEGDFYDPDPDALYRQRSDGTFEDISAGNWPAERDGYGFLGGWFDADGDGWIDLYVVNDRANGVNDIPPNMLLRNLGDAATEDVMFELAPEIGLDRPMLAMGLALGDMDNDGDIDLHASNIGATLLARNDDGLFTELSTTELSSREVGDVSWGTIFFDHDHDGLPELFTAFGQLISRVDEDGGGPEGSFNAAEQRDGLWRWDPDSERYHDEAPFVGVDDPASTRTVVAADLNGDGFSELITWRLYGGPRVWRSACNERAWLEVRLRDAGAGNRAGVGAIVEAWSRDGQRLSTGLMEVGSTGTFSSSPALVSLGLGSADEVAIVVRWPDGGVTVSPGVGTRRKVVVVR